MSELAGGPVSRSAVVLDLSVTLFHSQLAYARQTFVPSGHGSRSGSHDNCLCHCCVQSRRMPLAYSASKSAILRVQLHCPCNQFGRMFMKSNMLKHASHAPAVTDLKKLDGILLLRKDRTQLLQLKHWSCVAFVMRNPRGTHPEICVQLIFKSANNNANATGFFDFRDQT